VAELLFEIFCEEIPARMQVRAGQDLDKALTGGLKEAGLEVKDARVLTGPRRLVYTADVPLRSPDVKDERKGPKVGKSGDSSFRWVRPLQSMICLHGGDVVPVSAGGVTAGNSTEGHRRHGKGPFTVKDFADYQAQLESKGHVLLSAEARKALILKDAREACAAKGVELVEDEGLLNEVAGLAEWPVVILGDMDPSFLELPAEVIRLSMRTHQKYFAVKKNGSDDLAQEAWQHKRQSRARCGAGA